MHSFPLDSIWLRLLYWAKNLICACATLLKSKVIGMELLHSKIYSDWNYYIFWYSVIYCYVLHACADWSALWWSFLWICSMEWCCELGHCPLGLLVHCCGEWDASGNRKSLLSFFFLLCASPESVALSNLLLVNEMPKSAILKNLNIWCLSYCP